MNIFIHSVYLEHLQQAWPEVPISGDALEVPWGNVEFIQGSFWLLQLAELLVLIHQNPEIPDVLQYSGQSDQRITVPILHDCQISHCKFTQVRSCFIILSGQNLSPYCIHCTKNDIQFLQTLNSQYKYIKEIFHTIWLRIYQYVVTILESHIIHDYSMALESTKQCAVCHSRVMP